MQQLITQNANTVKLAIDFWQESDYPDYFSQLHIAYTQMGTYADTIAQGIIKQHPELFQ
jgi:predicted acyl esterase